MVDNYIKIGIVDLDGIIRGKLLHADKFDKLKKNGAGFCNVIFGWDSQDDLYDHSPISNWENGFMDYEYFVDLSSKRVLSKENDGHFYFADFYNSNNIPPAPCPRTLLRKTIDKYAENGLEVNVGIDLEWFNFKKDDHLKVEPIPITKGMFGYSLIRLFENKTFFQDIISTCSKAGIQIEGFHTETGPGVVEAALTKCDPLQLADNIVLFKTLVKNIAHENHITPSFMSKWSPKLPGCSAHIHLSFTKQSAKSFQISSEGIMNDFSKQFISGVLANIEDCMLFYLPNINSYKRLVEGSWAPTTLSWGFENRTTAIRIIRGQANDFRIEFRLPGADHNPYLALSALMESGLRGLNLKPDIASSYCDGNAYTKNLKKLPQDFLSALSAFNKNKVLDDFYDSTFIEHFKISRKHEWNMYQNAVTDWELKRYFEII